MELRHIRYFLVLSEELHFTRAADRCGVSQPCLSAAVRKMESELGGVLVHRRPQPQLSDLGHAVRPLWDEALRKIDRSFQLARDYAGDGVRVAATEPEAEDEAFADADAIAARDAMIDAALDQAAAAEDDMTDVATFTAAIAETTPVEAAVEPISTMRISTAQVAPAQPMPVVPDTPVNLAPVRLAMEEIGSATVVPRAEPVAPYEPAVVRRPVESTEHYGEKSAEIVARLRDKLHVASSRAGNPPPGADDAMVSLPSRLAPSVTPARPLYTFDTARTRDARARDTGRKPLVAAVTAVLTAPATFLFGRSRPQRRPVAPGPRGPKGL